MRSRFATVVLAVLTSSPWVHATSDEVELYARGTARDLTVQGKSWRQDGGTLVAEPNSGTLWASPMIETGDFTVRVNLAVDPLAETDTAILLGGSTLGLQRDENGRFKASGPLFRQLKYHEDVKVVLRDGQRHEVRIERRDEEIHVLLNDRAVCVGQVNRGAVGRLGLRPGKSLVELWKWTVSGITRRAPSKFKRAELQPKIDAAIARGVDYLKGGQSLDGSWPGWEAQYPTGTTSLGAYTLIKMGVPASDPAVQRALDYLARHEPVKTYDIAVQLMALSAAHDPEWDKRMKALLRRLLEGQDDTGCWGYVCGEDLTRPDLSNTQYAALGLRAAHYAGITVPPAAWNKLVAGTLAYLCEDRDADLSGWITKGTTGRGRVAGFAYYPGRGATGGIPPEKATGSMTTAGISILGIAEECYGERLPRGHLREMEGAKILGLHWLSHHFDVKRNPNKGDWTHYYLYGLERVGSILQVERIGPYEWYWEGATHLTASQRGDGSWAGTHSVDATTCFALLFLKRATSLGSTGNALAGGPGGARSKPEEGDLVLITSGDTPLSMWLAPLSDEVGSVYRWESEYGRGLHVTQAEFLARPMDGGAGPWSVITTLDSEPTKPSRAGDFASQHSFLVPGKYEVMARLHVVPAPADEGKGPDFTQTDVLESGAATVQIKDVLPPALGTYGTHFDQNLMRKARAIVSASSAAKGGDAANVTDDRFNTRWMFAGSDKAPKLDIRLKRKIRANTLLLTHAYPTLRSAAGKPRVTKIAVTVNDAKEPLIITLDPHPLAKTEIPLPRSSPIGHIEIQVLELDKGTLGSVASGFAEIELQNRR